MASLDSRTIIELLATAVFTIAGWWLTAEKNALKAALRTGLQNIRTELETERSARKEAVDSLKETTAAQGRKIDELEKAEKNYWTRADQAEFRRELFGIFGRLEEKLDRALGLKG